MPRKLTGDQIYNNLESIRKNGEERWHHRFGEVERALIETPTRKYVYHGFKPICIHCGYKIMADEIGGVFFEHTDSTRDFNDHTCLPLHRLVKLVADEK